jgi:3-oxoacyl-[acyl-carrier-protein] synthase II
MTFGYKGPVITSLAACASSVQAFVDAFHVLQRGDADVVVAGGTESAVSPLAVVALARTGAMSRRNEIPPKASRPFDRDRDGFVFGEGAGAFVLETEAHAHARGARIYAELAGGALTCDAYHVTAPDPTGEAAAVAVRRALEVAQVRPEDVDYICAHGTSTPLNDVSETRTIKLAFGKHAYRLAVSSNKSMVGHLMGGAGAVSGLACVMTIRDGIVSPTINLEHADPECDLDYVPNVARAANVRVAIANGFGFGGQNAVAVFRAYEP